MPLKDRVRGSSVHLGRLIRYFLSVNNHHPRQSRALPTHKYQPSALGFDLDDVLHRERERGRHRQTDRQTETETERQSERERELELENFILQGL